MARRETLRSWFRWVTAALGLVLVAVALTLFGCAGGTGTNKKKPDSTNPDDPNNPDTQQPQNTVTVIACEADTIDLAQFEPQCTCTFSDGCVQGGATCCDVTKIACSCSAECLASNPPPTCPFACICTETACSCDFTGAFPQGIECTSMSCSDPDDTNREFGCTASECEVAMDEIFVEPNLVQPQLQVMQLQQEEVLEASSILTVIDPSESMRDNQTNLACAVQSLADTVTAGGGAFDMGVAVMNVKDAITGGNQISQGLVGTASSCTGTPQCAACGGSSASGSCTQSQFNNNGSFTSDIPTLQRDFVLGSYRSLPDGNGLDEAGLEYGVLYLCAHGCDAYANLVAFTDEDADADWYVCDFRAQISANPPTCVDPKVNLNSNPPADITSNNTSCRQHLIDYYTSVYQACGVKVNALVNTGKCTGPIDELSQIYMKVAQNTGGAVNDVCVCEEYNTFWQSIGQDAVINSNGMCSETLKTTPESAITSLTCDGNVVPKSATEGWTLDSSFGCIVLHGTLATGNHTCSLQYAGNGVTTPTCGTSEMCLPNGTSVVVSSIKVYDPSGAAIPVSSDCATVNGYTFDTTTGCFDLCGTLKDQCVNWAQNNQRLKIEYVGG